MKVRVLGFAALVSASALSSAVTIMDQIGAGGVTGGLNASQDFEAVNNAFDIGVIDDFSAAAGTTLTQAEFVGGIYPTSATNRSWNNVTAFRVEIYSSAAAATASLTGDVASLSVAPGSATIDTSGYPADAFMHALVTLPISVTLTNAGTYWIGIIPVMNFGGSQGQTGIAQSTVGGFPGGLNGQQANPGGGFGIPGNLQGTNNDAAYRLTGSVVPEPGTMAVLGIGAAALLRRRRK